MNTETLICITLYHLFETLILYLQQIIWVQFSFYKYCNTGKIFQEEHHCVKSVRIRNFSDPYSVQIRENADQKNSKYGHFLRSESMSCICKKINFSFRFITCAAKISFPIFSKEKAVLRAFRQM